MELLKIIILTCFATAAISDQAYIIQPRRVVDSVILIECSQPGMKVVQRQIGGRNVPFCQCSNDGKFMRFYGEKYDIRDPHKVKCKYCGKGSEYRRYRIKECQPYADALWCEKEDQIAITSIDGYQTCGAPPREKKREQPTSTSSEKPPTPTKTYSTPPDETESRKPMPDPKAEPNKTSSTCPDARPQECGRDSTLSIVLGVLLAIAIGLLGFIVWKYDVDLVPLRLLCLNRSCERNPGNQDRPINRNYILNCIKRRRRR